MVDDAVDRPGLVPDRERVEHQPEQPACVGERSQLVVGEVARVVVERPAGGVRADHGRAVDPRRAPRRRSRARRARGRGSRRAGRARPRARGRARRGHRPRRPRRRRGSAGSTSARPCACRAPRTSRRARSRSRTAPPPRARASARSGRPARPRRGRPRFGPGRAGRVTRARRGARHVAWPSASRSDPSGWRSSSTKAGHTWRRDASRLEQRQPGAGERLALAEVELAVAELEEQIEVGVGDHGRSLRARSGV